MQGPCDGARIPLAWLQTKPTQPTVAQAATYAREDSTSLEPLVCG